MPYFVVIVQTAAEIWRFFDLFKDSGRRHLGIFKFLKF